MKKLQITYQIAGRPTRGELVVEFALGEATSRDVARAILAHEFAEVVAPFGLNEGFTAEQALARFAITDVRTSAVFGSD